MRLTAQAAAKVYAACGQGTAGAVTARGLTPRLELLHEAPGYLQACLDHFQ